MILYNNAFDLYHTIFRMLQLISKINSNDKIEVDRVRIWDFYLLFPSQIFYIRPRRNEVELKKLLKQINVKKDNPYQRISDERITLEKIKPYQISALSCLASYNIISKDELLEDRISIISKELLTKYIDSIGKLSAREKNIITIVTSQFYEISLFGENGLKKRSDLLESKYDAE
ncbi:ABC-three component system middle component 5 [uncultured Chryseobacterium sp.]|uniref:ABC-three component system middle component 5 n=1 Tax=uncultured Chryseobacterium sp. TaxID=259322 RepID=UPI002600A9F6|nr:ABC-three component system middle component 5 [uncultured Chryseobacterium sp.]